MNEWDIAKIESDKTKIESDSEKDPLEVQASWISTLLWNLEETISNLQESHDCNFGKTKPQRRGEQHSHIISSC